MSDQDDTARPPHQLEFHFIKSNYHCVIVADGAYGGITPAGYVHMSFYNERRPLPRVTARALSEDGETYSEEQVKDVRSGLVREIETTVVMNELLVRQLRDWLDKRIQEFEGLRKAQEKT